MTVKDNIMKGLLSDRNAPSVGGRGGHAFSSGSVPSGATQVTVTIGGFLGWERRVYQWTLKRIHLEFKGQNKESTKSIYKGYEVDGWDTAHTSTFTLMPDDRIVKAVVWSDDRVANAVQFYTAMGVVSPMYGSPEANCKVTVFEGKDDNCTLVGVYGRYGGVLDAVGFAFAPPQELPDSVVAAAAGSEESSDDLSTAVSTTTWDDVHVEG